MLIVVHTILGKKANRSSSLSQVINYFDSSPSMSERSLNLLDSPLHKDHPPRHHISFYNPRDASDSDSDSDDEEDLRDQSPEAAEQDNHTIRSRTRGSKGYIAPKRWPERLSTGRLKDNGNGETSSSSSGMGTSGSNSTTSLPAQNVSEGGAGRQNSPGETRGSGMSDIGSEDLPMTKLSVSRNENYETRTMSPFVLIPRFSVSNFFFCSFSVFFVIACGFVIAELISSQRTCRELQRHWQRNPCQQTQK